MREWEFEALPPEESVTFSVASDAGMDSEEEQGAEFGGRRGDGGTSDTQCRAAEFTKDQDVVQHNVGEHHYD